MTNRNILQNGGMPVVDTPPICIGFGLPIAPIPNATPTNTTQYTLVCIVIVTAPKIWGGTIGIFLSTCRHFGLYSAINTCIRIGTILIVNESYPIVKKVKCSVHYIVYVYNNSGTLHSDSSSRPPTAEWIVLTIPLDRRNNQWYGTPYGNTEYRR